jgi:putative transposase
MGVHAAPRLDDFSYRGEYEYSLTICTASQRRWFVDAPTVARARTPLLQLASEYKFEVTAYCFMPDHVHALVTGTSAESDLRKFVGRWKQASGYAHKLATNAPLWQGGFYDHVLRQEEDRRKVIRYLLNNPIRAGLVSDLRDYAYWGSGVCSRDELIEVLFDRAGTSS